MIYLSLFPVPSMFLYLASWLGYLTSIIKYCKLNGGIVKEIHKSAVILDNVPRKGQRKYLFHSCT